MYPLRAALDRGYDEAVEATKAGEPVAWCMRIWWLGESILKAMGVVTVYPENFGAVCAAFGAAPATWSAPMRKDFRPICAAMPEIALAMRPG